MNHLDLFSGIGGFALAASRVGWKTVAFCEIEPFCQSVLRKHWPGVPIHEDIKSIETNAIGEIDIITGVFPCQPFSTAARGRNNGEDLWPYMQEIIESVRPSWVVAENVAGNKFKHIDRSCANLASVGYTVWPLDISVETRRHQRRRFWIVAHANSNRESDGPINAEASILREISRFNRAPYPGNLGVDDGLSEGVDRRKRLKALGNAIIPQIAEAIFVAIDSCEF